MMRSLSSAVSGLRAHQTKMDVIGNNIANVNTYGFKSSRVTFQDVYYQTLSSGNAPTGAQGGTNPTQIGYGAKVATIDVLNSVSAAASTDRALDIYINGDGMIIVRDPNGNQFYTRMGVLGFDAEGRLVDMNGNFVLGFKTDNDGKPIVPGPGGTRDIEDLDVISVETDILDELTGIAISNTGEIIGTMAGDPTITANKNRPAWLIDVEINENSNTVGDIKLVMEAISTARSSSNEAWITDITAPANSMVDGDYDFFYDDTNKRITAVSQVDGKTYTGTYRAGSTIELTDASGNVGFVLTTHAYTPPSVSGGNTRYETLYFDMSWQITLSGTDKGGNKLDQPMTIDDPENMPGTLIFSDLGVTLTIDSSKMEPTYPATLDDFYSSVSGSAYGDWLIGAVVKSDSTLDGPISIKAGIDYVSKTGAAYSNLNFMSSAAIQQMVRDIGIPGQYKIKEIYSPGTGLQYELYTEDSNGVQTTIATSDPITTNGLVTFKRGSDTWDVGTYNLDKISFNTSALTSAGFTNIDTDEIEAALIANGLRGKVSLKVSGTGTVFEFVDEHGTTMTLTDNSGTLEDGSSNALMDYTGTPADDDYSFATRNFKSNITDGSVLTTVSEANKIFAYDSGGNQIGEATFTGQSSVTIGDITLSLDPDELKAFFDPANNPPNINTATDLNIGRVNHNETYNWVFDRTAASASTGPGESFVIGQLALAQFQNMAGMTQEGNGYFSENFNSGKPYFWIPGLNGTGELTAGYLEMSNVDISKEFTDMITTQRGFQANTRIITVSDEMLQELVNLKR